MKYTLILITFILLNSCATTSEYYSSPQDSSRNVDAKYTQVEISSKIPFEELDKNLSRFYVGPNSAHITAIPLTGALLDNIGFIKAAKDDYNKFEYKKISAGYRAYLYNKVSCFYIFVKGDGKLSDLKIYDVTIGNTGSDEHKATIKSEQEHESMLHTLNELFPKTYSKGTPRSIDVDSVYTQELICGNRIDFQKPFFIKLKSPENSIELFWL